MSRYINYDAIDYRNYNLHDKSEEFLNGIIYMAQRIEDAPTIDAVSVVRCKECKYASDNKVYGCMCNHFNDNDWDYHRMYADDFCSRGEREGE